MVGTLNGRRLRVSEYSIYRSTDYRNAEMSSGNGEDGKQVVRGRPSGVTTICTTVPTVAVCSMPDCTVERCTTCIYPPTVCCNEEPCCCCSCCPQCCTPCTDSCCSSCCSGYALR